MNKRGRRIKNELRGDIQFYSYYFLLKIALADKRYPNSNLLFKKNIYKDNYLVSSKKLLDLKCVCTSVTKLKVMQPEQMEVVKSGAISG